jgi:hypothetical protein
MIGITMHSLSVSVMWQVLALTTVDYCTKYKRPYKKCQRAGRFNGNALGSYSEGTPFESRPNYAGLRSFSQLIFRYS